MCNNIFYIIFYILDVAESILIMPFHVFVFHFLWHGRYKSLTKITCNYLDTYLMGDGGV